MILSYGAALGIGTFFFENVFDFPGIDPTLPLFAFIFLVALGIDYNIFLMARVREETLTHGTRDGMIRGLAVTGTVITSAGLVLAGTFSALARPAAREPDRDRLHDRDRRPDRHLPGPHRCWCPRSCSRSATAVWWPSALAHTAGRASRRSAGEPAYGAR